MTTSKLFSTLSILLISVSLAASVYRIRLKLPAKPPVALDEEDLLLVAPFVLAVQESDEKPKTTVDVQVELTDFLAKTIGRKGFKVHRDLTIILPTSNLDTLKKNEAFFKKIAAEHNAAYILTGSVDFQAQDRSTYETQSFESRVTNRTYYRQILVERTGFNLDLILYIFNRDGKLVKEEPLKKFLEHEVRNYDQLSGFFETLHAVEGPILHLFVPYKSRQERAIFGF